MSDITISRKKLEQVKERIREALEDIRRIESHVLSVELETWGLSGTSYRRFAKIFYALRMALWGLPE